jgi:hypothetical protein
MLKYEDKSNLNADNTKKTAVSEALKHCIIASFKENIQSYVLSFG